MSIDSGVGARFSWFKRGCSLAAFAWSGSAAADPPRVAVPQSAAEQALAASPATALPACGPSELAQSKNSPEAMLGIRLVEPTPVVLTAVSTSIRCEPEENGLACSAETTYEIANRASAEARIRGVYYGASSSYLEMSIAGRRTPLNQFYDAETLAAVERTAVSLSQPARTGELNTSFDFTLPPSSSTRLSFKSTITPCQTAQPDTRRSTSSTMLQLRHPYFASQTMEEHLQRFSFELWAVRLWAGNPRHQLKIIVPSHWVAKVRGFPVHTAGPGVMVGEQDGSQADVMVLTLHHAKSGPLLNGGPLVAIGGRLDRAQLRLRAGYELGIGKFASTSLVLDHEPKRYSSVAWMWEVGTHSGPFWPSFTIGSGPLLRLGSGSSAAGGRVQAGLSLKVLSFGVSLDIHASKTEQLAPFAFGQLSL